MALTTAAFERLMKIHTLHVLFADGRTLDLRSVPCPVQQRDVGLGDCLSCEDSGGLRTEGTFEYASCCGSQALEEGPSCAEAKPGAGRAPTSLSDVMTTDVLAVRPEVSLELVLDVLLEHGFGGAPVVDGDCRPIGVVSRSDIFGERFPNTAEGCRPRHHAGTDAVRAERGLGREAEAQRGPTAVDAMTRGAITLPESATVSQAAAVVSRRGVHRVIVVSVEGRVAGVVSTTDIARWVADDGTEDYAGTTVG